MKIMQLSKPKKLPNLEKARPNCEKKKTTVPFFLFFGCLFKLLFIFFPFSFVFYHSQYFFSSLSSLMYSYFIFTHTLSLFSNNRATNQTRKTFQDGGSRIKICHCTYRHNLKQKCQEEVSSSCISFFTINVLFWDTAQNNLQLQQLGMNYLLLVTVFPMLRSESSSISIFSSLLTLFGISTWTLTS